MGIEVQQAETVGIPSATAFSRPAVGGRLPPNSSVRGAVAQCSHNGAALAWGAPDGPGRRRRPVPELFSVRLAPTDSVPTCVVVLDIRNSHRNNVAIQMPNFAHRRANQPIRCPLRCPPDWLVRQFTACFTW